MNLNKMAIIHLDAHPSSTLQWGDLRTLALKELAAGKGLLWHLDFGLFSRLPKPLENQEQFLTLLLAIDHFKETVFKEFQRFTRGVVLYRGSSDFSIEWQAGEFAGRGIAKSLCARNLCANYLSQIASHLPEELPPYLLFDKRAEDPLLHILAGDPDAYGRVLPLYQGQEGYAQDEVRSLAVLMPPVDETREEVLRPFQKVFESLQQPYKMISESRLLACWNGLDRLIYSEQVISPHGRRLLNGFQAAGGEVEALENLRF